MRIVDLTHTIDPEHAGRKFELKMIGADEVNHNVIRLEDQWYIMHDIAMVSHIGTHIEMPYHIMKSGNDLAEEPLEHLCGDCVLLDLRGMDKQNPITVPVLEEAAAKAGGIRPGDIVLCNLGYADRYGTEEYGQSPYFTNEGLKWLIAKGMKLMGVDAGGVEIPRSEEHVNHIELLAKDIPLIENIANLNALDRSRFKLYAFPAKIKGLESFTLRVVAILED